MGQGGKRLCCNTSGLLQNVQLLSEMSLLPRRIEQQVRAICERRIKTVGSWSGEQPSEEGSGPRKVVSSYWLLSLKDGRERQGFIQGFSAKSGEIT